MEPYYYSRLDRELRPVYERMLHGLTALDSEIQLPRVDAAALSDLFFRLRLDHPEIFWRSALNTAVIPTLPT